METFEFNVGDIVRVKESAASNFVLRKDFLNRNLIITNREYSNLYKTNKYEVQVNSTIGMLFGVLEDEIELVKPKEERKKAMDMKDKKISIISDGKTVIVSDGEFNGVARCNPEDKFDLLTGINLALERFNLALERYNKAKDVIHIDDWVKLVNDGAVYSTYAGFFKYNNLPIGIAAKYAYGSNNLRKGRYKVVEIGKHESTKETIYVITDGFAIYLVGADGVEKI